MAAGGVDDPPVGPAVLMAHLPRAEWIARRARSIAAAGVVIHDANLRILLLDATAVIATRPTKAELRAAVRSFEHATRSKIRADRQHAGHLRHAAKQLFRTTSQGDGEGVAILLSSLALLSGGPEVLRVTLG